MPENSIEDMFSAALDHHHAGRLQDAERLYQAVLDQNPNHPSALHYKGVIALQTGDYQRAAQFISQALVIEPDDVGALVNLATAQTRLNNAEGALETYHRARDLNPEMPEVHYNLGILYQDEARYADATDSYRQAIALRPNYVEAHYNLGVVLQARHQYDEAAGCYEETLQLDARHTPALTNLGCVRHILGNLDEAARLHNQALALDPGFCEARSNLGRVLQAQGQLDEAEHAWREALRNDPEHAQSHVNLAMLLLLTGQFDEGWQEYGWRWKVDVLANHGWATCPAPEWSGEPLDGKNLLIVGEQGIGEQIMFSTLIPRILEQNARVTFACDTRLVPLYTRSLPGVQVCALTDQAVAGDTPFDFKVTAGTLPRYFWSAAQTPPVRSPLLQADPVRVRELRDRYTARGDGAVIGIAWHSDSPTYFDQKNIDLDLWAPIFEAYAGCTFVSLQYGSAEAPRGLDLYHDTDIDALSHLDDHAAQIAAVDHVISISNATVHLAGALGTPCTVMVGDVPLWHWFLERTDSPWYDGVEIFRRGSGEGWQPVIDAVAAHAKSNDN